MDVRTRLAQMLRYADGVVGAAVTDPVQAKGDAAVDAHVQALRTGMHSLAEQVVRQAVESVDRWASTGVCNDLLMDDMRLLEITAQTANALHRASTKQVLPALCRAVRAEMRRLFKNAQVATLRSMDANKRPMWCLVAGQDACPRCAALARAGVDDLDVLGVALADDDCGSTLLVQSDVVETKDVVQRHLRIHNVPVDAAKAVVNHVAKLRTCFAPLLRDSVELTFTDDSPAGLASELANTAMYWTTDGKQFARWSWMHMPTIVTLAMVDDAKLPVDRLRVPFDQLTANGWMSASSVYVPAKVIHPLAVNDLTSYARCAAVAYVNNERRLAMVDQAAYDVFAEYMASVDPALAASKVWPKESVVSDDA